MKLPVQSTLELHYISLDTNTNIKHINSDAWRFSGY
jgi:hypothetical protein